MRIEIECRKRWERAGVAVILLLFLSPGQYIFFKNMPDFLFELSLLLTALLFYAAFIKIISRRNQEGDADQHNGNPELFSHWSSFNKQADPPPDTFQDYPDIFL